MAQINLLPWREQMREERKREFIVLLVGVLIIGAGIIFLFDRYYRGEISYQQARNDFIQREMLVLDARIAEIRQLRQQKEQINARMAVIQDLQGSRPMIVRIFDELVKALPAGVYFNSLRRRGDLIDIQGIAESNNRVSELMRRLDDSEWFSNPNLQQISAAQADAASDQTSANAFSLTLTVQTPARDQEN
jgi:type IV pilus assembly protein PilN